MKKLNAWLVILAAVVLGLHASGAINVLGRTWMWVLSIIVLLIGLNQLLKK